MYKNLLVIFSCLMLVACGEFASSTQIYTSEGKKGYAVNCSGVKRNWGLCYQKAGTICKERGYEVLEVTGEAGTITSVQSGTGMSTATTNTTHNRIMIIQCKFPEPAGSAGIPSDLVNF